MNHRFMEFQPFKGEIPSRINGSLISMEKGSAIPYALDKLQERGKFFVFPNEEVYTGQVIGENSRIDATSRRSGGSYENSISSDKIS